jgi:uncharacterized OsmC-like protein
MLGPDDLETRVTGEVEKADDVLVLERVHAIFRVKVRDEAHDTVERVAQLAISKCPVARSIEGSIAVTTAVEYM